MTTPALPDSDRPPVTVQQLCARFEVDMRHARHVAAMALALFDSLPEAHGLPPSRRGLLEAAALLHNLGMSIDPEKHHTVGRDLILFETLEGHDPRERDMLACTTRFHRKKVRPGDEPVFLGLPESLQRETLALAALLRAGDALDYSGTQTCRILSAGIGPDAAYVLIDGPHADAEAERARKKADLWDEVFPHPLRVRNAGRAESQEGHVRERRNEERRGRSPESDAPAQPGTGAESGGKAFSEDEDTARSEAQGLPLGEAQEEVLDSDGGEISPARFHPLGEEAMAELTASEGGAVTELEPYDGPPAGTRESSEEKSVNYSNDGGGEIDEIDLGTVSPAPVKAQAVIVVQPEAESTTPEEAPKKAESGKKGPGVSADDPIAEAGRKTLRFHFERLLANEAGTLEGEDIEALHDMRVATRRLRAATRLYGPFLPEKEVRRLEAGLKRTGRTLGPVRDLDVMLDKARRDAECHPELDLEGLDPLLKAWEKERKAARKAMTEYLHGGEYEEFKEDFEKFLSRPEGGKAKKSKGESCAAGEVRVRYVAPGLVWEHYGQVRAYEPILPGAPVDTLHALRIDGKRFRYALEFLREPLGKEADKLIKLVTEMQDHLGDLHDADVAAQLLRQFLEGWWRRAVREGTTSGGAQGITDYLLIRERELREKVETFPAVWGRLTDESFRRRLADLTAAL